MAVGDLREDEPIKAVNVRIRFERRKDLTSQSKLLYDAIKR